MTPRVRNLLLMGKRRFNPLTLFAAGEQGAWYDPSDLTSMYQDSAGTTAVTAPGQGTADCPVGKINDKSGRGNHAIQATAASRPVLSARTNIITATSEFPNGLTDGTVTGIAPLSATTLTGFAGALLFGYDGVNSAQMQKAGGTIASGDVLNFSLYVQMTDGLAPAFGSATVGAASNDFCLFVANGAYISPLTYVVTQVSGPLYRVSATATSGGAVSNHGLLKGAGNSNRTFKTTGWHIEKVSSLPRYQRVVDASTYDTSGFPLYLAFAVDDSLATAAIPFTGTKMTAWAGVRKNSDASVGVVAELSAAVSANVGTFLLDTADSASASYGFYCNGGVLTGVTGTPFTAPITNVISVSYDTTVGTAPAANVPRVNGATPVVTTVSGGVPGGGAFASYPLYIGARAGSSLFLNGNLYQLIVRGAASTAAQIASGETFTNTKTQAY